MPDLAVSTEFPTGPGRSRGDRLRRRAGPERKPCASVLLCLYPALLLAFPLFAQGPESRGARPLSDLTVYFPLQETDLGAERGAQVSAYVSQVAGPAYYLVQGFGCDTGGYTVSIKVATLRGQTMAAELQRFAVPARQIFVAQAVVLTGERRVDYRRAEVRLFRSAAAARQALAAANRQAARTNELTRQELARGTNALFSDGEAQAAPPAGAPRASAPVLLYLLLALVTLLIVAAFIWIYTDRRGRSARHTLDPAEAQALELLTGGEVSPLPPPIATEKADRPAETAGRVTEFIRTARKQTMGAKKKSKTKITPISIRGAVNREFEEQSLSELARSPIHALEGLTPRHARMLEEGFGIKTVEDLARLKYVEIARAIVVLARYEK